MIKLETDPSASQEERSGVQGKNGKRGQSSNPWPGFLVNHTILNIPVKTDPMAVICRCSFIMHI